MKFVNLGEICNISTGSKDVNEGSENGRYLFFTCAAVPLKSDTYSFDGESLILPGNGANVGMVFYHEGKFEAYQRTYVLNNFKNYNARYVYWYLIGNWRKQNQFKQFGSATNYIKMNNFLSFSVPCLELEKQKNVVKLLDFVFDLKQKRKRAIELLDDYLRAVFYDMFGDPVKNEKEWERTEIENISTKVSSGSTPLGGSSVYQDSGILFIRSQNIHMNRIVYDDIVFISDEIHNRMKRTWVKIDDVLLNITGASIGRVAVFKGENDTANVNQHVCIIRPINSKISSLYLSYLISTDSFQSKINSNNLGATRQAFNFEQIKKFEIILPPLELQNKFAQIVEQVETTKAKMNESLKEMDNLFNSLMQQAFKG